ncbi:BnaA04g26240D [Brassica napus]|uniref:BnaA04g26240D protein n=1 Tax=Brassica napus TaxID=3708 RepID=A0A078HH76_BRANA|nr:BnaA04g26240D [Brassica napus]
MVISNSFDYFDSSRTMNSISEQNMVNMSFLRGIIDSFSSIFTEEEEHSNHRHEISKHDPTVPTSSSSMNGVDGAVTVTNERVAYKLKGYFDLAKEEISKGVRAEEWGLHDDALLHYRYAQRIMNEASSTPSPSYITSSEKEKVRLYREKISKWQSQVSGRLQALGKRTGVGMSENKRAVPSPSLASVPSSNRRVSLPRTSLPRGGTGVARSPKDATTTNPKPAKEAGGGYDDKLVEMINTTIVDRSPSVKWDDVAGLDGAKQALMEMVILPAKRRDLFTGLRRPARGLLLFGPPGNGKTMLAKAVASESQATFFNVSASSLTSKWVGEAEKLVKTLFQVAISRQPSVIFMDEIDSIMSTRSISENEASRRLKSEFLIQFDGVTSNPDDLVIVIGATNKPQELDDAVLRRLVKRIYVPLPDPNVRKLLFKTKLKCQPHSLSGYSGSDLQALCEEAAMMPIRELGADILTIQANKVRPLSYDDFRKSMGVIRPSLSKSKWEELEHWNSEFGSN